MLPAFSANEHINPIRGSQQKFPAQKNPYQRFIPLLCSLLNLEELIFGYQALQKHDPDKMHYQLITHLPVELAFRYQHTGGPKRAVM